VTAVMRQIVLPYLAELGDRWERGDASIAQAHFASNLIRSAGRAGTRLGRRERPAGHPGLPARGVARPGPNDLRRHPEPPRVADRLPRRDTPVEEHRWSPQPAAALLWPNGLRLVAGYTCLPRRFLLVLRSRVPHWCSSW